MRFCPESIVVHLALVTRSIAGPGNQARTCITRPLARDWHKTFLKPALAVNLIAFLPFQNYIYKQYKNEFSGVVFVRNATFTLDIESPLILSNSLNDHFCPLSYSDLKQNKGSILKASVEYIKDLKKDKQKLHKMEERQKVMDNKCQKLLFRIFVSIVKTKHINCSLYEKTWSSEECKC